MSQEQDTIVCSENILSDYAPSCKEKEFFVVIKQDTSAYSFIFSQSPNGNTRMEVSFMKDCKMFILNSDINKKDTTVAGGINDEHSKMFRIPGYKEMLKEMELCLNAASKDYDMQRLESVKGYLINFSDIAVSVNNELESQCRQTQMVSYHEEIEKALNNTAFKSDLNNILSKYGVYVDKISSQEFMGFIPQKEFIASQSITKGLKVPERFLDAEIYIELKQ